MAQLLIAKGADASTKNSKWETPLHIAARYGRAETAKLLIAKGVDVDAKDNTGRTPLHMALGTDLAKTAAQLILEGAAPDTAQLTAAMLADTRVETAALRPDTIELLIAAGADINTKDNDGKTPLQKTSDEAIRQLLIEHGAVE